MFIFAPKDYDMKTDFHYSTDFYGMNARELSHTCMHLLCKAGEGSFVFNEHCYHIASNDLVVIPMPPQGEEPGSPCRHAGGMVCRRL